jgi:para-nitrobenzyl esterase
VTSPDPQIRTTKGAVRGRLEDGLAVFRGIPFAQPPVGPLRFQAPRPAEPWAGTRNAQEFGVPPPQPQGRVVSAPPGAGDPDSWLTVNVWSPALGAARLPVLVWIYGGAYVAGASSGRAYDGAALARRGVVVVSFNYRLGMEGFAQLTGAPANRGLLDQVAALRWVQDNVAGFGGDPGQVTVFGESAGAGSVASLLAMPEAAGLCQKAIVQSLPGTFFSAELAADIATVAARSIGLPPAAAALSDIDPHELVAAGQAALASFGQHVDRWGAVAHTLTPFSPVVDGEVLPDAPWPALAAGRARDVELIIGHNRDECRLFTATTELPPAAMQAALTAFSPPPDGVAAYQKAYPEADTPRRYELAYSDWLFRMPALLLAEAQAAAGGTAHLYELTYPAPGADGALGACHGLDVPLVFGTETADFGGMLFGDPVPESALALGEQLRADWTAFAAGQLTGWPAYEPAGRLTRIYDDPITTGPYPEETSRRLWAGHQFGVLGLA